MACSSNPGYSLVPIGRECTRIFNVYRAADGGFVFGTKAFKSNLERKAKRDTQRAIFGLAITLNEPDRTVSAELLT